VAQGLRTRERSYLLVWHRGPDAGDPGQVTLPVPHLRGGPAQAEVLFGAGQVQWWPASGELTVRLAPAPAACLIRLTPA
jgi:hypothetical protein